MELTLHQAVTEDAIVDALHVGHKRIILKGAAGVGKTHLVSHLITRIQKDYNVNRLYNNGLVYVTAPTNKAMAVLQGKIPDNPRLEFKTVHSALRLKMYTNPLTGMRKFVPEKNSKYNNPFNFCKIAFVDEASMLNSELLAMMEPLLFPIVFIGDEFQINPVGEVETPVFKQPYTTFELTEIIRQGPGNPIIDLSRDIDMVFFKQPKLIEGKGYIYNEVKGAIIEDLAEVNGTDEAKYLTWTNPDVDGMNSMVRKRIYGNPRKVELGEIVVFNSPMHGCFYTNQEVKVETVDIVTAAVRIPTYQTHYDGDGDPIDHTQIIKMRYYRVNESFDIVHEDSEVLFKEIAGEIKDCCKNSAWNWKGFYSFTERFADIKYNHAITTHKSQGSTYKQVILNVGNIYFNKNAYERQRLMYTAVTRASDLVVLHNVK